ncbi:haloalkane dehalogenase isoform X2 [Impatiens glandulifera]|uniref:haloalkane dehalogenase isoform X2 n=1 Tax=Impatiens glandulifera TaxID=253017 RepID=UPI001FB07E8D|nr:haloalkane dehalogenase isoform X2 [Impatiens glandulifera]
MAWTWSLLSPPPLNFLANSFGKDNKTSINDLAAINCRCWRRRRRSDSVIVRASEDDDEDKPSFNPFGFVTDNPSSRNAIQLPESPAEDGNVGQMLYRIEDKGRDFGSTIRSGKLRWFVRETGSGNRRGTVVLLHGAPTQSFSYRVVMSQMADSGYHCYAPDWIGFGFSDMPQPGYGFNYTEEEFHTAFDGLLDTLEITSPFSLVVQGFLVGSYGLTWALKNPSRIQKLAILNSPLTDSSPVPGLFKQLSYVLKLEKADVYRLPYLQRSAPGFALLESAKKANFKGISSQIAKGFMSERWDKPILVIWGIADKYLPNSVAEEFQKGNPKNIKLKLIEGAGHMPQEDWPEKVVDALRMFF